MGHAGDQVYTRAQDRATVEGWKTFSPEGKLTILQLVAEGDRVVVLWTGEGINTGEGNDSLLSQIGLLPKPGS